MAYFLNSVLTDFGINLFKGIKGLEKFWNSAILEECKSMYLSNAYYVYVEKPVKPCPPRAWVIWLCYLSFKEVEAIDEDLN